MAQTLTGRLPVAINSCMTHPMRSLMQLCEMADLASTVYERGDLIVLKNPPKRDFLRLYRTVDKSHGEGLRAVIVNDGDLFVWDGYFANHDEVATWMHLDVHADMHLWNAYVEIDISNINEPISDDEPDRKEVGDRQAAFVRANPNIQRLYGADAQIKIEDDYEDWWA